MKDYIFEHGIIGESDIYSLIEKYYHDGCYVYAIHTDSFFCSTKPNIKSNHLLELRIFTENDELKLYRSNIGTDFSWRYIDDNDFENTLSGETNEFLKVFKNRVFDEEHYLDIDTTKSQGTHYTTTGGGEYTLPLENAEKVKIRNYLEYDKNGIVFVSDFRIVGFTEKGSLSNG